MSAKPVFSLKTDRLRTAHLPNFRNRQNGRSAKHPNVGHCGSPADCLNADIAASQFWDNLDCPLMVAIRLKRMFRWVR